MVIGLRSQTIKIINTVISTVSVWVVSRSVIKFVALRYTVEVQIFYLLCNFKELLWMS